MFYDLSQTHRSQKDQLEIEQNEELFRQNSEYDKQLIEMNTQFELANSKLAEKQEIEIKENLENYEASLPQKPKPSTELLHLNKSLDGLGKQRE
jgi:hypothetical protein